MDTEWEGTTDTSGLISNNNLRRSVWAGTFPNWEQRALEPAVICICMDSYSDIQIWQLKGVQNAHGYFSVGL